MLLQQSKVPQYFGLGKQIYVQTLQISKFYKEQSYYNKQCFKNLRWKDFLAYVSNSHILSFVFFTSLTFSPCTAPFLKEDNDVYCKPVLSWIPRL